MTSVFWKSSFNKNMGKIINNKTIVISQPFFFPWVGLFEQIRLADVFVHYDDVQFIKRNFHDRVQLKTQEGSQWMTVPKVGGSQERLINEVQIDNSQNWKRSHIDLLKHMYKKAPFLNDMLNIVNTVYENHYEYLHELTISSIMAVAEYFDLVHSRQFFRSSDLNVPGKSTKRLLDIVKVLHGDRYITGMGALKYFDFEQAELNDIKVEFMLYEKRPYPQLYQGFNPYVSILDLIANVGKNGSEFINSGTVFWKEFIKTDIAKNYLTEG